jgi:hypothetical protein
MSAYSNRTVRSDYAQVRPQIYVRSEPRNVLNQHRTKHILNKVLPLYPGVIRSKTYRGYVKPRIIPKAIPESLLRQSKY